MLIVFGMAIGSRLKFMIFLRMDREIENLISTSLSPRLTFAVDFSYYTEKYLENPRMKMYSDISLHISVAWVAQSSRHSSGTNYVHSADVQLFICEL